ncbi:hypothetical protein [Pseudarthrobacter sp. NPDC058119]|uniref:hypothetical protein n=1 Tax=Pseudarthrobacter sp. NPDC058119 TaxID=3346348 RepID=UPI0036DA63A5
MQIEAQEKLVGEQTLSNAAKVQEFEERMDRAVSYFEAELSPHGKEYLTTLLKDKSGRDFSKISDQMALEAMEPKMEVLYKELNTKDAGAPGDVMSRLHPKQVQQVNIEFGRWHDERGVGVHVALDGSGAKATLAGEEMFVNGAVSQLTELFRQQRPRARWMRSPWFLVPFGIVASIGLTSILVQLIHPGNSSSASWWTPIAAPLFFWGLWEGMRWLVPAFELIPPGKKSRSQWAFAAVGAVALSVVASFVYGAMTGSS